MQRIYARETRFLLLVQGKATAKHNFLAFSIAAMVIRLGFAHTIHSKETHDYRIRTLTHFPL